VPKVHQSIGQKFSKVIKFSKSKVSRGTHKAFQNKHQIAKRSKMHMSNGTQNIVKRYARHRQMVRKTKSNGTQNNVKRYATQSQNRTQQATQIDPSRDIRAQSKCRHVITSTETQSLDDVKCSRVDVTHSHVEVKIGSLLHAQMGRFQMQFGHLKIGPNGVGQQNRFSPPYVQQKTQVRQRGEI
jgi:hypothetical protein